MVNYYVGGMFCSVMSVSGVMSEYREQLIPGGVTGRTVMQISLL